MIFAFILVAILLFLMAALRNVGQNEPLAALFGFAMVIWGALTLAVHMGAC